MDVLFVLLCLAMVLSAGALLFIYPIDYIKTNYVKGCLWHLFIRKKIFVEDGCTYYECPKCKLREGYLYAGYGTINEGWLNGGPQKRPIHDADGRPIPPSLIYEIDVPSLHPFRPKHKPAH